MLAAFFYFLSWAIGLIILKKYVPNPIVRLIVSPVLGVVLTTWLLFTISLFVTIQTALTFTIVLLCIFLGLQRKLIQKKKWHLDKILEIRELLSKNADLLVFLLFWSVLLFPLFDSHMIKLTPSGAWQVGGSTYGDLALHLTYINKFSQQEALSLRSPIFSANQTTYPFLINFFAGMLVRMGASIRLALIATSFPFILAFLTSSYSILKNQFKSTKAGWIFSFLFLFNGGWGMYYFYLDWLASKLDFFTFLSHLTLNYSHIADVGIHWSNTIADYFLPQRGIVIGLGIFALCIQLYSYLHSKYQTQLRLLIALLIGLSPFFHIHTFLVMLPLSIWIDIWHIYFKKTSIKTLIYSTIVTLLVAFPQFYWQFSQTFSESFTRFHFGWIKGSNESILDFWFRNLGVSIILWLVAPLTAKRLKRDSLLKIISLPLYTIFIFTNFIIFQPHDYDNMKFMLMSYYGICVLSAVGFSYLLNKNLIYKIFVVLVLFVISFTGIISYYRESYALSHIATASDIAIGQKIKEITEPESIFLTSDSHNHVVTMIAGRNSVLIHPGWLWTHGIDYEPTFLDVKQIYLGGDSAEELLQKHAVDYVFVGENETHAFHANLYFFETNFERIYADNGIYIYKIKAN